MGSRINLIVPGLFDLPLHELDPDYIHDGMPALNNLLSQASTITNELFDLDEMIKNVLGLCGASCLPMAVAWATKDRANPQRLMLFNAVHLKPDMHSATVFPLQNTKGDMEDIDLIINDLRSLFKVDCDITKLFDSTYLMALNEFDPPTHYPHLLSIIGKKANQYIEQSRYILPWYKLINEMQMFMHQHEVNQDRIKTGLLPINSLWCWGSGHKPEGFVSGQHIYCDDRLIRQFADSLGIKNSIIRELNKNPSSEDILVIDLSLLEILKLAVNQPLQPILTQLETRLFEPLLNATKATRCSLRLRVGHPTDLAYSSHSAFKFWRPRKTLVDFTAS